VTRVQTADGSANARAFASWDSRPRLRWQ
jgi:hypothetical protein